MRIRLPALATLLALTAAIVATPAPAAAHRPTVDLGIFYQSLPLLAAQEKGFFERAGLDVRYQQVTSSTQQFQALRDGEYDLVATAIDNVANYRLNDSNALGRRLPVQAFHAMDHGQNLSLVGQPGMTKPADLRGKVLAVDAPNSGFAFVAYGILRQAGLEPGRDYQVRPVGGTVERYGGLQRGDFDATLLAAAFETLAAEQGKPILAAATHVADPYLGIVAAGLEPWLNQNRTTVHKLTHAYAAATKWSLDPRNREQAIDMLHRARPAISRDTAERLYEIQTDTRIGNAPDGRIRQTAVKDVLDLRQEWNGFDLPQDTAQLSKPGGGLYRR